MARTRARSTCCARDGQLLVLEIKSSFVRRSLRDAWIHRSTTLRKAGRQLARKLQAVSLALQDMGDPLRQRLGLAQGMPMVHGWIVDTSVECDHQRFDGFLKVSLEEVLIALRDERHLLNNPEGLFRVPPGPPATQQVQASLYPDNFTAARFIGCIESGEVWANVRQADASAG